MHNKGIADKKLKSGLFTQTFLKKNRKLINSLKLLLVAVLLIGLFWLIPLEDVWAVLVNANLLFLVAGILIVFPNLFMKSARLGILTRKLGLDISSWELFAVNLMVKFYLLFLPGMVVGSGIRWAKISIDGKKAEAAAAVGFGKIVEIFFTVITGLFWFFLGINNEHLDIPILLTLIITIAILWILFSRVSGLVLVLFEKHKESTEGKPVGKITKSLFRLMQSMKLFADMNFKEIGYIFGVSILAHIIGLISFYFLSLAVGLPISIFDLAWSQSFVSLLSLTPLYVFGGLGLREVSLVMILGWLGVSSELTLAFSLIIFMRNVVVSLTGGVLELQLTLRNRKGIS